MRETLMLIGTQVRVRDGIPLVEVIISDPVQLGTMYQQEEQTPPLLSGENSILYLIPPQLLELVLETRMNA